MAASSSSELIDPSSLIEWHSLPEVIAQSFKQEMTQGGIASQLYTDALALQLAIHLLRHYTTQSLTPKQHQGGLSQQQVKCLIDYMQVNLVGVGEASRREASSKKLKPQLAQELDRSPFFSPVV